MVNMSKRYADSDSEDNNNSSSDEDNGNFKRRRRTHSSSDEDFVHKTLQSFVNPEVKKPLIVTDSRETQKLIQRQKVVNEKLSKLPKYDDLFVDTTEECLQSSSVTDSIDNLTVDTVDSVVDSGVETKVEVTTDVIEVLAGGDSRDVTKTIDPRLKRLEKFKPPPEPEVLPMNPNTLMRRVHELLNKRKPSEAYTQLRAEVSQLEIHKHVDLLMIMAKDWFPAQIDTAYDPRNVFIEATNLMEFAKLLKDVFSTKVKSKVFWEAVIHSVEKFIDESRIKELPQLLARLRWILVKDIRNYLVTEEVIISLKTSAILVDHKVKLECNRDNRRRLFEASVKSNYEPRLQTTITEADTEPSEPVVPIIMGRPVIQHYPKSMSKSLPQPMPKYNDPYEDQGLDQIQPTPVPTFLTNGNHSERRTINQISECLNNDQYFKLIQMLDRHTRPAMRESNKTETSYTFIDNFGHALRLFYEKFPKFSVNTIYQKLHDTLLLNIKDFQSGGSDSNRIIIIFEKFLKEFHETVLYNPKEWLLIREHTRSEHCHFKVNHNPFNEPFVPILHNIIIDCGYHSSTLRVNYTTLEEEIPLMSQNVILKDPRMELLSEDYVKSREVIHLDDSVSGVFSPIRSDTSSPNTSPEYFSSGETNHCSDSDVNSDANSDIIIDEREDMVSLSEPNVATDEISTETAVQKTENANPIRENSIQNIKSVKTGPKKVLPLKNHSKLNNKTISNKTFVKKKKLINEKTKTVNKSPNNLSKPQNIIKLNAKSAPKTTLNKNESQVKPKTSIVSDINSTTNSINSTNSSTVATNNGIPDNNSVVSPTDVPQKRMIRLNGYNESELKKIVRRVSISSDDSSNED